MAFIVPFIGAGLTPIIGGAAADFLAQLIPGLALTGLGLLFAEKPPDPQGGRIPIQQDTPPRGYAYGRERVAGSILLAENVGDDLIYIVALVSHASLDGGTFGGFPVGFEEYYLDDRVVRTVTDYGENHIVDGMPGDGGYGNDSVQFYWRHGAVPSPSYAGDPDILPDYADNFTAPGGLSDAGLWTEDHRADGITTLLMICNAPKAEKFAQIFPNGKPTPSVVGRWRALYDPRDLAQDPADETTWVYSENIALELLHLLCFNEFTADYDFTKSILPVISKWKAAADLCDEGVALSAGGTEPRYGGGGFATTVDKPATVGQKMLQACDGMLIVRGDRTITLTGGKFEWNGAVITDDLIVGFQIQNGPPDEEAINTLNGRFVSPEHGYGQVECDPYGEESFDVPRAYLRPSTMDMPWVKSFTHARRLMKREVFRQNHLKRGYFDLKLSALNCAYERWIKIVSTRFPTLNGTYIENRRPTISLMQLRIRIEWTQAGNGVDIDLWDKDTDEGARPPVPYRYNTVGPDPPHNVNAAAQNYIGEGGTAVRLIVSFDEPVDIREYRIRWRIADIGGGIPGRWHDTLHQEDPDITGGRVYLETEQVPKNQSIEVQALTVMDKGTISEWSAAASLVDTSDPAPAPPVDLAITLVTGFPRPTWTMSSDNLNHHAKVYRVTTAGGFGSAIDVSGDLPATANVDVKYKDTSATTGTWDYYVTAASVSDNESTPSGPVTIVV